MFIRQIIKSLIAILKYSYVLDSIVDRVEALEQRIEDIEREVKK